MSFVPIAYTQKSRSAASSPPLRPSSQTTASAGARSLLPYGAVRDLVGDRVLLAVIRALDEVTRILFLAAGALALASCAPTVNLLNPTSPRFEGAFAPPPTAHTDVPVTRVRVVSFNIKFADRIDAAIEVLRSDPLAEADIISLQEMDESGTERIARALQLNYVYYPGSIHPARHRYFGPAVLSRWPIEESWKLILPHEAPTRRQRRW